jgi:hypothetical protein
VLTSTAAYQCRVALIGGGVADSGILAPSVCCRHTVDCRTDHALTKAAQTWLTACTLLLLMTAGTNYLVAGGGDFYDADGAGDSLNLLLQQLFTLGDLDHILDSLPVLALWRFLMSSMLGTGGR